MAENFVQLGDAMGECVLFVKSSMRAGNPQLLLIKPKEYREK